MRLSVKFYLSLKLLIKSVKTCMRKTLEVYENLRECSIISSPDGSAAREELGTPLKDRGWLSIMNLSYIHYSYNE